MPVDAKAFKDALSRFASGVTVVTAEDTAGAAAGAVPEVVGITVSAFISVSIEPPLILVSIDKRAKSNEAIARAGRFAVSVLAAGQEAVSNYYAGWRQPDQVVELARPDMGTPVVAGALAWIDCSVYQAVEAGDHTLYLGRVEGLTTRDGEPLIYFRSRYRALAE
ncbi:MAG: flavin reductase family protein [Pseudomonadota bacterium]|nr:flavin reductase family protein [Pseudomonadota bacterium]